LKDAFGSIEAAAHTSAWLDVTFNGDFLRLVDDAVPADDFPAREAAYRIYFDRVAGATEGEIFLHLEAILKGWSVVGRAAQTELDWDDLDFAHIPVGLLSQVYESFSHRDDAEKSRRESVHYTPRPIARLMVDEVF